MSIFRPHTLRELSGASVWIKPEWISQTDLQGLDPRRSHCGGYATLSSHEHTPGTSGKTKLEELVMTCRDEISGDTLHEYVTKRCKECFQKHDHRGGYPPLPSYEYFPGISGKAKLEELVMTCWEEISGYTIHKYVTKCSKERFQKHDHRGGYAPLPSYEHSPGTSGKAELEKLVMTCWNEISGDTIHQYVTKRCKERIQKHDKRRGTIVATTRTYTETI